MDRRGFLKHAAQKTTQQAVEALDARAKARAKRWIRPPFALAELEFLLTCTRCGACTTACPHDVVFSLDAKLGADVVGTPALDLTHKACHLCQDWPCVQACEPKALSRPEEPEEGVNPLPILARCVIDVTVCLPYIGPECGACAGSCPVEGALKWQGEKPSIDGKTCIGCGLCRQACVLSPSAIKVEARAGS